MLQTSEKSVPRGQAQKKKKKNKRAKRRANPIPTPFLNYAHLVADPCHGAITSGISSEGAICERSRRVYTSQATATAGYVVWFPSYSSSENPATSQQNGNLYLYGTTDPANPPDNTVGVPMGTSSVVDASGLFLPDPSASFVSATSPFSRTKALSACMQLEWLGKLSDIQGQVCVIKNISLSALDTGSGSPGHTYTPMSVDQVFAYGATRERAQVGGHEVVWRPTPTQCVLRTNGTESTGLVGTSVGGLADVCFNTGTVGSRVTEERSTLPNETLGILIAWKGFPAGFGLTQITCVKTFELELAPRSGAIESIPRAMSSSSTDTMISKVTEWLDVQSPGWQSRIMNAGVDKVGSYAMAVAPRILRSLTPGMMGSGRRLRLEL